MTSRPTRSDVADRPPVVRKRSTRKGARTRAQALAIAAGKTGAEVKQGFVARGAVKDLFYCRAPEVLLEGPAGCVAGETELWDPVAERGRRIDELERRQERPWVLTLGGPVLAEVPFVKGVAALYRVTLENGASCLATA